MGIICRGRCGPSGWRSRRCITRACRHSCQRCCRLYEEGEVLQEGIEGIEEKEGEGLLLRAVEEDIIQQAWHTARKPVGHSKVSGVFHVASEPDRVVHESTAVLPMLFASAALDVFRGRIHRGMLQVSELALNSERCLAVPHGPKAAPRGNIDGSACALRE